MSIRDGLEPSRSPDSDTHTQPIPRDEAAPDSAASSGPRLRARRGPSPAPAPAPATTRPPRPTRPGRRPGASRRRPRSRLRRPPTARPGPSPRPLRVRPGPSRRRDDRAPEPDTPGAQPPDGAGPAWGQGGGGYPTTPAWGARPADAGSPRGRRPSRWLAGAVAGVVLLAAGYGISEAIDRDPAPAGAGIPTARPDRRVSHPLGRGAGRRRGQGPAAHRRRDPPRQRPRLRLRLRLERLHHDRRPRHRGCRPGRGPALRRHQAHRARSSAPTSSTTSPWSRSTAPGSPRHLSPSARPSRSASWRSPSAAPSASTRP